VVCSSCGFEEPLPYISAVAAPSSPAELRLCDGACARVCVCRFYICTGIFVFMNVHRVYVCTDYLYHVHTLMRYVCKSIQHTCVSLHARYAFVQAKQWGKSSTLKIKTLSTFYVLRAIWLAPKDTCMLIHVILCVCVCVCVCVDVCRALVRGIFFFFAYMKYVDICCELF
jgi:hypothetical protein